MLSRVLGLCASFRVTRNPDIGRQLVPKNALTLFRTLNPDSRDTQSGYWQAAGTEKCSHMFLGLCAPFRVTRNPNVGRQLVPKNALTLFRTLRAVSRDTQSGCWPTAGGHSPDCGRGDPLPGRTTHCWSQPGNDRERVFLNCYGAQESIPRNRFRQPL
jgi:hypothetical protein